MSSSKQKEMCFSIKPRDKLQQPQQQPQQQEQNDHRPTEEIQSASSHSMPKISMNYIENFEMATLCLTSIKREIGAMIQQKVRKKKRPVLMPVQEEYENV